MGFWKADTMGNFFADVPDGAIDPLDYIITERFRSERHPEVSVDGDDLFAEEEE